MREEGLSVEASRRSIQWSGHIITTSPRIVFCVEENPKLA